MALLPGSGGLSDEKAIHPAVAVIRRPADQICNKTARTDDSTQRNVVECLCGVLIHVTSDLISITT
jgi:hypothetical protein